MKKIISIILISIMCVSLVPMVSAARDVSFEESLAQDLKALGIFQGVSDTEFDLDRAPTRVEALVMLIRLLGKDKEALGGDWSHPFSDVPGWAKGYVGYAYENGLTKGISATEFGTGNANIQMFLTFVLRSLNYSDTNGADFSYSDPYSLSYHTGILPQGVDRENFLRADVVLISYAAMSAYMKNTSKTLASELIADGVFTESAFSSYYDKSALKNYTGSQNKELSAEEIFAKCSPAVFYVEVYDARGEMFGSGSGFFINSDGTAVTNYHVIDGAHSAKVKIGDTEEMYDVDFVYDYSEAGDWAVIQIDGSGFDYLEQGAASTVVGGAAVYAIGSPLGLQNTISQGIISNANRAVDGLSFIQTSAAISSGSSGGALINKYGQVIGITSAKFSEGENLGLALPITVIDECNYQNHLTLSQIANGYILPDTNISGNISGREGILDFITLFVENNYNITFDDGSIGYSVDEYTANGSEGTILTVSTEGAVSVIWYENYNGDEYYTELYISDPADSMYCYYSYESAFSSRYDFEAISYIDAKKYQLNDIINFHDYDGYSQNREVFNLHKELSSEYLAMIVSYVKYGVIDVLAQNGHSASMADLGFINYR